MKLIQILADIICNTLLDPEVLENARTRTGAFKRNCKKLPYWTVMKLLMKNVKRTISASLDEFFTEMQKEAGLSISDTIHCSQQAFSKARAGVDHTIFRECFERMLDFLCSRESLDCHTRMGGVWGRQIIAIDGSKIPLPNRKFLLEKYGSIGRGSSSPTAIASVAYDVLNNRILDAQFEPICVDERTLAVKHMEHIKNKARANLLYTMFVFDRGYASEKLISYIEDDIHARYLFRLRTKFNCEIDALPVPSAPGEIIDQIIMLNGRRTRVLRFFLKSGVLETLITNDFSLDKSMFQMCYFLRWPIEEGYKLIKENVGLTNFRGWSENSILQEFWIAMLLANLTQAIKRETDGIIDVSINSKNNKHKYQTNTNELVGYLSRHFSEYMDAEAISEKHEILRAVFAFAISHRVWNKKGCEESAPRKEPRKVKHHYNNKATH